MANVRNVVIDAKQCFDAFALKSLMVEKGSSAAMLSDAGLKANVLLEPPDGESLRREVSWNFAFPVIATDESTPQELGRTLDELLGLVAGGVKVAWGTFAGAFPDARQLGAQILTAAQTLSQLWDDAERPGLIGCGDFDVTFVPSVVGQPPTGFVGYVLFLESRWVNSAKDVEGNHGYTTCQEFKLNNQQLRASGVNSSKPRSTLESTNTYRYPVFATDPLPITRAADKISFQILSQVHCASGSFGNFNTQVKLQVIVAGTAEAVRAEIDRLTLVASIEVPRPDDGTALASAGKPWMVDVPPTLVATNGDARRLLLAARQGHVVHLGSHLGRMSLDRLQRIALGLQVEVGNGEKSGLAKRIAEKVVGKLG